MRTCALLLYFHLPLHSKLQDQCSDSFCFCCIDLVNDEMLVLPGDKLISIFSLMAPKRKWHYLIWIFWGIQVVLHSVSRKRQNFHLSVRYSLPLHLLLSSDMDDIPVYYVLFSVYYNLQFFTTAFTFLSDMQERKGQEKERGRFQNRETASFSWNVNILDNKKKSFLSPFTVFSAVMWRWDIRRQIHRVSGTVCDAEKYKCVQYGLKLIGPLDRASREKRGFPRSASRNIGPRSRFQM